MNIRRFSVGIGLSGWIAWACFAHVTAAQPAAAISNADAQLAGFMDVKANVCHADKAVMDRFYKHVMVLTESESAPEEEFVSPRTAIYLTVLTCTVQKGGRNCPASPYAKVPCGKFLRTFQHMRITRSDWRASDGFR